MTLNWKEWAGKKAHIILNNNYEYNCSVISISNDNMMKILDKFREIKIFNVAEIKFIEEKN